ncbi:hypothetical protein ACHAXA_006600 [Cyclostephanos tholiformis]|uniref:Domain of unknown function at the cortex 1 domain-containing protein n=1 Tax=Cyclostephanos tholiformis TaxID=382380 RepID=A0ABD3R2M2_9STRA
MERISSFARSLARVYVSSPTKDAFPDEEHISDAASTRKFSSIEASTDVDETIVSSTVIEFHEYYPEHIDEPASTLHSDDGVEHGICDNFLSKMMEMIPCPPPNRLGNIERISDDGRTDNDYYDARITTIECILRQTVCEDIDEFIDPASSLLIDNEHMSSNEMMLPPSEWIHDPLLFVATPGSGTRICRIRCAADPSYHECPESVPCVSDDNFDKDQLIQLPINNGKEYPSQCRVIDFETNLFSGTALLRIRPPNDCRKNGIDVDKDSTTKYDYFGKHNRKFQLVIRGKFKAGVIMADCMSGILLDHHLATKSDCSNIDCVKEVPFFCESEGTVKNVDDSSDKRKRLRLKRGKSTHSDSLPSKWALRAAVKVAEVFSPRMDADLECAHPRILSPLCSTAQTIIVSRKSGEEGVSPLLDAPLAEPPPHSDASFIKDLKKFSAKDHNNDTTYRVQQRKAAFYEVYDAHIDSHTNGSSRVNTSPCFDPGAEYTFEFLQHLVDYNDLSLDLGKVIGKVKLGGALRGQPARFVSAVKQRKSTNPSPDGSQWNPENLDFIWSFDLWHKSLLLEGS